MPYMIWSAPSGSSPAHPPSTQRAQAPASPVTPRQRGARVLDPAHDGPRLGGEAEAGGTVERERGVSNPGVPIIPVPGAPHSFRQTEGGGGHDRSEGSRGQELQGQSGAVHHLPPPAGVGRGAQAGGAGAGRLT